MMATFAERCLTLKEESGLNYRQMGEKCGFSKTNFDYWIRNGTLPSGWSLMQISRTFDVSIDWLMGLTEERETMQANTIDVAATGRAIENLMEIRDISVKEMQGLLGFTTPQAIYKWFWGKNLPTIDNMVILCDILGVKIDDILVIKKERIWRIRLADGQYLTSLNRG